MERNDEGRGPLTYLRRRICALLAIALLRILLGWRVRALLAVRLLSTAVAALRVALTVTLASASAIKAIRGERERINRYRGNE